MKSDLIGILQDIKSNKIFLHDDMSNWMRERLCELIINDGGPTLIEIDVADKVILTEAGEKFLQEQNDK